MLRCREEVSEIETHKSTILFMADDAALRMRQSNTGHRAQAFDAHEQPAQMLLTEWNQI